MYESLSPGLVSSIPDRYIAVSEVVATALIGQFAVPPVQIAVVPPHVEDRWLADESPDRDPMPSALGRPLVVGGAGMPSWTKGIELWLLTAAELVRRNGPDRYRFRWIGAREDRTDWQFRAMVTKLGLDELVELVPVVPEPLAEFQRMDILVVSSWEESASLVALEMMALGRPVACFEGSGGTAELVGDAGIVVQDFSPIAMADAVEGIGTSMSARADLGRAARVRVAERFSAGRLVPKLLDEIRTAVGTPSRAAGQRRRTDA